MRAIMSKKTREKMMTKSLKTLLIIVDAALIVLMLMTWSFLQASIQKDNDSLNQLITRKEDLMGQQQMLESALNDLNNTLQQEIAANENLKAELAQVTHDAALAENVTIQTPPLAPPQAPPKPVITPVVQRPVTRAS